MKRHRRGRVKHSRWLSKKFHQIESDDAFIDITNLWLQTTTTSRRWLHRRQRSPLGLRPTRARQLGLTLSPQFLTDHRHWENMTVPILWSQSLRRRHARAANAFPLLFFCLSPPPSIFFVVHPCRPATRWRPLYQDSRVSITSHDSAFGLFSDSARDMSAQ